MSVALRIGFGSGYFVTPAEEPPPAEGVANITDSPYGGWTSVNDPKAMYYNGKTYLGWINADAGGIYVASYDHSTETLSTPFLIVAQSANFHNSPALMVRESDKRIIVAWTGHSTAALRIRVSTNPEDVTSFAASVNLDSQLGGNRYTYPVMYQLKGVTNDPIYLFWRDLSSIISNTGRLAYSVSLDNGATWSARTLLFTGAADRTPYWRIISDWDTRIDVFTTDREHTGTASGLWHFYIDGTDGTIHQSDGTEITATQPFQVASATQVITGGPLVCLGGSWDGTAPATIVLKANGSTDNRVQVARWRAGAWQVDEVIASVGGQITGNKYFSGAAIDPDDPDIIYFSRKIGTKFELYRYVTADDGDTWTGTAITSGSEVDNVGVEIPHFGTTGFRAMWMRGTYVNDGEFDFGISVHQ